MKNLLRRVGALAAAVMMCFALTVPALADDLVSSSNNLFHTRVNSNYWRSANNFKLNNGYSVALTQGFSVYSPFTAAGWSYLTLTSVPSTEGTYGVYLSLYYFGEGQAASQNHAPVASDFSLRYTSSQTGSAASYPVSIALFAPSGGYTSKSDGVTVSARFTQSVSNTVSNVSLVNGEYGYAPSWTFVPVDSSVSSGFFSVYITSFSYVSTDSDTTLDGLENIADSIAAQNSMLSAYYGDIVAVCNQIYQRLGDMQQTQIEANELLSSLVSLLNSTNGKISALNQAMSTYFELVLKSLENESLSIQDCINDAEARLEAYLKPMIDYFTELEEQTGESASTLPQHKTDLDGFDNQGYGIDGDGQAGLAALVPIFGSFSWIFSVIAIFVGVGIINLFVKKGLS